MLSKPLTIPYHALHFCVAVAVVLLKMPGNIGLALGGALQDPDSYMRLVRMKEALDRGRWFGDAVSRDFLRRGRGHPLVASPRRRPSRLAFPADILSTRQ